MFVLPPVIVVGAGVGGGLDLRATGRGLVPRSPGTLRARHPVILLKGHRIGIDPPGEGPRPLPVLQLTLVAPIIKFSHKSL